MHPALRLLLAFLTACGGWWLMHIAFAFFPVFSWPVQQAVVGLCALVLGAAAWRAARPGAPAGLFSILRTALPWGVTGFVLGFLGPMVLAPGANQGPLLGFFTGPAGFVLGAIVAFVRGRRRSHAVED